jgi:hypothetical protein
VTEKPMLECTDPEIGALLMSYGLGTLTDAEEEKFELHLLHCPACQQEIESASLSLNALSEAREQFVLHAHQENEDFESQYEKLARDRQTVSAEVKVDKSRGWLEVFWEAVWGRRWIIGTAGAVAIAMVFVLREGPKLTQPSVVKDESVSMHYVLSPPRAGMKADTSAVKNQPVQVGIAETQEAEEPRILTQPIGEKKEAITLKAKAAEPRQVEQYPGVIAQQEVMTESAAEIVEAKDDEVIIGQEMVVQYDAVTSIMVDEKLNADSNRVDEYDQIAEIVLGKLDPDQYSDLYAAQETESPEAIHSLIAKAPEFKVDEQVEHKRAIKNDSSIVKQQPAEAWDSNESQEKRDTTDASPQVMAGVASLAKGDYAAAKVSLESTYRLLPEGVQRNDIGLLLVRTDILAGQFEEAKGRLQSIAASETDSVRKAFTLSAVAKIDSFINSESQKQAPPK